MQVEVHNNTGVAFHSGGNEDVVITVTVQDIVNQRDRSYVSMADTVCRIKIVDDKGRFAWFAVTPSIKNGSPGVIVENIYALGETHVKKKVYGKWRNQENSVSGG